MTPLTCAATRRRLHAFHDRELPIGGQIAVASHVEWCDGCAAALAELRLVRAALRAAAPGRRALSCEEAASLQAAIAGRVKAEHDQSFSARVHEMFEDMHFVYAGLGGVAAAIVCVVITLGLTHFATSERPGRLLAIVSLLATPGSNENPVAINDRVLMPRALDGAFSAPPGGNAEEDTVFTLAAVVTREGRIANLELLHAIGDGGARLNDAKLVERLLEKVSRARFEPARVAGLPVAVNMVWLVARTTVRATKRPIELSVPPTGKKGAASLTITANAHVGAA